MRKIAVVTGSRAEYGLLYWLLRDIEADPGMELLLVVTGMHLSVEFGLTCRRIEEDGFNISCRVDMLVSGDTPVTVTKSMGLGLIGFADALSQLKPDIMVVLGDRFEIMVAVQAAMVANIPIAHIHGGEVTEGAMDEAIRHSITKMADLHFVASDDYRRRVIQLGEQPDRVFNFGPAATDNILRLTLPDMEEIESKLGIRFGEASLLVTYHPETVNPGNLAADVDSLLQALREFDRATVIFTRANADPGGGYINDRINDFVRNSGGRAVCIDSPGQRVYLGLVRAVDSLVGNSSSGIIEAPLLGTPTVNIGDRQSGRTRGRSVIDCPADRLAIASAIRRAISSDFRRVAREVAAEWRGVSVAVKIKTVLRDHPLAGIKRKKFFDIAY
ncbi:MAG: UDP-N-acetylglucosamine 2-epimerase [Negativicutes bacterium]|nr:UDP-N-acetylglucosamine 2-epimerase [Negativicutes bacterium]